METALNICIFIIGFLLTLLIPTIIYLRSYKKEAKRWKDLYEQEKHLHEDLVFDGVDDFVKYGEKGLKDYTVIKLESWSVDKGHSHIIILENRGYEKRNEDVANT